MRAFRVGLCRWWETRTAEQSLDSLCSTWQERKWAYQWVNQRAWELGVTKLEALRFEIRRTMQYGPRTQPPPAKP